MDKISENEPLKRLQKYIEKSIEILESSNLSQVDQAKYNELKTKYNKLTQKILTYQTQIEPKNITINPTTPYSLQWEFAQIDAEFEYYMNFQGGYKKIRKYQINKIRTNLEKIISKLNKRNYLEIQKKLNDTLKMYSEMSNEIVFLQELKDLLDRFNYQVYKYKIEDLIYDDSSNITSFITYAIEDINRILNNDSTASTIKDRLQIYLFDINLIKSNFNRVIMLINLGNDKNQISEEQLNNELNQTIYRESDLEKEYFISAETRKEIDTIIFKANTKLSEYEKLYKYVFKHTQGNLLKALIADISYGDTNSYIQYCVTQKQKNYLSHVIEILLNNNFTDFKYLAESILKNNIPNQIAELLNLKAALEKHSKDYSYDINCAVFAHVKDIKPQDLIDYIIATDSELLLRYVLKSENKDYFNAAFVNYARTNNRPILNHSIRTTNTHSSTKKESFSMNNYTSIDEFIQILQNLDSKKKY